MTHDELIEKLANKALEHRLVLFLGAGFSKAVLGDKLALSWLKLLEKIAKHFNLDAQLPETDAQPLDYPELASRLCRALFVKRSAQDATVTYAQCVDAIKSYACRIADWRLIHKTAGRGDRTGDAEGVKKPDDWPTKLCETIKTIDPVVVITTNYDHVIESILEGDCVSMSATDVLAGVPTSRIPIYHLHGICDDPRSIVLTREDYVEATRPFSYRQSRVTALLRECSVLYVGYGKNDFNILSALDVAQHAFGDVESCAARHGKELHVQLIYPSDKDYPHRLYEEVLGGCHSGCDQRLQPVEMCEHYTKDTIGFLMSVAERMDKVLAENSSRYEKDILKIKSWSEDVPDENDVSKRDERRNAYEVMFKEAHSSLISRSIVGREVIKEFCNNIEAHYKNLKDYSNKKGQFVGYAYCWAFLSAYFQVLDDNSPYSLFSVYSPQFCDAVYLLNGLAKKVNELSEKNKFTDCEKLPVSCRWICEDWKHKFTPTVKIAILEQAELMAEQGDKDDSIKVLIGHVEETLKGWR